MSYFHKILLKARFFNSLNNPPWQKYLQNCKKIVQFKILTREIDFSPYRVKKSNFALHSKLDFLNSRCAFFSSFHSSNNYLFLEIFFLPVEKNGPSSRIGLKLKGANNCHIVHLHVINTLSKWPFIYTLAVSKEPFFRFNLVKRPPTTTHGTIFNRLYCCVL